MTEPLNIDGLADDQLAVVEAILNPLTVGTLVVQAGAGTGKSTIIKLISAIKDGPTMLRCATSNTAAHNIGGGTLHKMLQLTLEDVGDALLAQKYSDDVIGDAVILLDEFSMLSTELYELLVAASPRLIVLFGDVAQLPAVGGKGLKLSTVEHTSLTLSTNYRASSAELEERIHSYRGGRELTEPTVTINEAVDMANALKSTVMLSSSNENTIKASTLLLAYSVDEVYFMQPVKGYIPRANTGNGDIASRLDITIAYKKEPIKVSDHKPRSKHVWGTRAPGSDWCKGKETYGIPARDGLGSKPLQALEIWYAMIEGHITINFKPYGKKLLQSIMDSTFGGSLLERRKDQLLIVTLSGGNLLDESEEGVQLAKACLSVALGPIDMDNPIWIYVSQPNLTEDYYNLTKELVVEYAADRVDRCTPESHKDLMTLIDGLGYMDLMTDYTKGTVTVGKLGFKTRVFQEGKHVGYRAQFALRVKLVGWVLNQLYRDLLTVFKVSKDDKGSLGSKVNRMLEIMETPEKIRSSKFKNYSFVGGYPKDTAPYKRMGAERAELLRRVIAIKSNLENVQAMRSSKAMTVYMAQGLGFDRVIVNKVKSNERYTAVSRARKNILEVL